MMDAVTRLVRLIEAEHVQHRTFRNSPPTRWCAACSPTTVWPCALARLATEVRADMAEADDIHETVEAFMPWQMEAIALMDEDCGDG